MAKLKITRANGEVSRTRNGAVADNGVLSRADWGQGQAC